MSFNRYSYDPPLRGVRAATNAARQVWKFLYPGEPFVLTVGFNSRFRRHRGVWFPRRLTIELRPWRPKHYDQHCIVRTLVHEFTHVRNPGLRHGQAFEQLVERGYARLGGV